jgi:hypothetical protein
VRRIKGFVGDIRFLVMRGARTGSHIFGRWGEGEEERGEGSRRVVVETIVYFYCRVLQRKQALREEMNEG